MILQDVPIGSQVRLFTMGGVPVSAQTKDTMDAWVVAGVRIHPTTYRDRLLLGWRQGEKSSSVSGWAVDDAGAGGLLPPDRSILKGYTHAYWAPKDTLVDRILQYQTPGNACTGMFCRGCRNWSPYASPNRPSGNFVCWSCRQGFIPRDW